MIYIKLYFKGDKANILLSKKSNIRENGIFNIEIVLFINKKTYKKLWAVSHKT